MWSDVINLRAMKVRLVDRAPLIAFMDATFNRAPGTPATHLGIPPVNQGLLRRLLNRCPCLFNQIDIAATARAMVHFCEITLGCRIDSGNVYQAFLIQHPRLAPPFNPAPLKAGGEGGTIMEFLCSEALRSVGIPPMELDGSRWPVWRMPGHVLLNESKMNALRAFGDILIHAHQPIS
ncbi:hypothetical protein NKJ36_25005 [Mesorhizobium sp. M0142]